MYWWLLEKWKAEEIRVGVAYLALVIGYGLVKSFWHVFLVQHYSFTKRSHNTREVHLLLIDMLVYKP